MSDDYQRFVRLGSRARNGDPVDERDIQAAFDAVGK